MENKLTLLEYLKTLLPDTKIDIMFFWVYVFEDNRKEYDEEVSYYGIVDDFFNFPLSGGVSFSQDYGERYFDTYNYKIIDTDTPVEIEVYGDQWG